MSRTIGPETLSATNRKAGKWPVNHEDETGVAQRIERRKRFCTKRPKHGARLLVAIAGVRSSFFRSTCSHAALLGLVCSIFTPHCSSGCMSGTGRGLRLEAANTKC